jgi:hypothetical protein
MLLRRAFIVLTILTVLAGVPTPLSGSAGRPIEVVVNGARIAFPDQGPVIVAGRTLVPVRFVSQALGARVDWDEVNQSVRVAVDDTVVLIKLGLSVASVNGIWRELDVPAQAINGRTMVPLRFISEAFGASVLWDYATHTVTITRAERVAAPVGPPPKNVCFLVYVATNREPALWINATRLQFASGFEPIIDRRAILVPLADVVRALGASYEDFGHGEFVVKLGEAETTMRVVRIATVQHFGEWLEVDLPAKANYVRWIHFTHISPLAAKIHGRAASFCDSALGLGFLLTDRALAYDGSRLYPLIAEIKAGVPLETYDLFFPMSAKEFAVIRARAEEIVSGVTSELEQLRALSTWVSANVFYDFDALGALSQSPYVTLNTRRGVCVEYSTLLQAMLYAVGIPARLLVGHQGLTTFGHMWVEAFVDGRWVITDPTWNSRNQFRFGTFGEQRPPVTDWFDIPWTALSHVPYRIFVGRHSMR